MTTRKDELQFLFRELNQRCFDGRLRPKRIVVMSPNWKGWHGEHGRYDSKRRTIRLAAHQAEHPEETMLHEMCHIGAPGYGKAFLAKLDHLALLEDRWVAEWASKEASLIRDSPSWNQTMREYIYKLDEWADRQPRPTFIEVVLAISQDLRMSSREILKLRRRWLERAWEKAIRRSIIGRKYREILEGPNSPRTRKELRKVYDELARRSNRTPQKHSRTFRFCLRSLSSLAIPSACQGSSA